MTKRNSTFKLLALAAAVAALQACGGGGGNSAGGFAAPPVAGPGPSQPSEPAPADSGAVAARFAPNDGAARFMLMSSGSQYIGNNQAPSDFEQADSGAVTRLGPNSLSGTSQTVDIAGDANFALGRWARGTATLSTGARTLTGKASDAFHYVAFNGVTQLPDTGTFNCTSGTFTAPTKTTGATAGDTGSVSDATATLTFSAGVGAVQGSIGVSGGGETANLNLTANLTSPTVTSYGGGGGLLSGGAGTAVTIADGGDGTYALIVGYRAQLPGGASYLGVGRLSCTAAPEPIV